MKNLKDLLTLRDILLGPDGCAWDKAQTLDSLKKYLLEEAQEVVQAIENKDLKNLQEELGDLLFQIVFIAKVATINMDQIIDQLYHKLIRRHSHIFGEKKRLTKEEVAQAWKEIKKKEKENKNK